MKPYKSFSTRSTPQSEPIPDVCNNVQISSRICERGTAGCIVHHQVENNAGGFVYGLSDEKAFERFLVLGSEGGTYYVGEHKLTRDNAVRTMKFIAGHGAQAVDMIVSVSDGGRAPKNDSAIFALALAASTPDPATRILALAALPKVCRIPTHLFQFITYVKQFRGFGRGLKTALGNWYQEMPVEKLAYQVVKYQQRDGWSNADVLRLSHPKTPDPTRNAVYKWVVDGHQKGTDYPAIISGFEASKLIDFSGDLLTERQAAESLTDNIRIYNLSREMLPTEALTKPEVWEALLEKMPLTAMIRNLGNMSKVGLLVPLSAASKLIAERLHDAEALKKARIHPIAVLIAMKTYSSGHGLKGKGTWTQVPLITDALDDAFYLAFKLMEPTGKRLLFGVDVSGSMGSPCGNLPITCAEGAAAMALACAKSEKDYYIMGFSAGKNKYQYTYQLGQSDLTGFRHLGITPNMSLNEALTRTRNQNFGATDCSVPMTWATKHKALVDGFIVITDNETYAGDIHPSQALREYREKSGINAKEIVIGMTATNFTIADPNDPGTLDVAGFDASVPQVIGEFLK